MLGSNPTDSQVQDLVNAKDFDGKKCACVAVGNFAYRAQAFSVSGD